MVIDTSAVVAIFLNEPERDEFLISIKSAPRRLISAANLLEIHMVLARWMGEDGLVRLDRFLKTLSVEVVAFDLSQARIAADAFVRYGKGRNKAALNFGDCMAYALAKQTDEPLLFKGDDFGKTDVGVS